MKVHRRGTSSPSLLLEASEPPTSVNVNGNYYQFELEPYHVERGKRGQKVFVCDICPPPSGIFKRSFSLKRHYLRFHINFAFLSPRDLNNCAIAVAGQQQRGFQGSGNGLVMSGSSALLYRCHQCGSLLKTKADLLKHLKKHAGQPSISEKEVIVVQERASNRCPRCSTAFTLRKTLVRHIKKNRCRGGNLSGPVLPKTERSPQSVDTTEPCDDYVREEESEEMDMEASLKLGCPTSLFRFACTLCFKMFNSYVNMCRHRRLAHGRYGICSPHWFLSRKLPGKSMLRHSVPLSVASSDTLQNSQDLTYIIQNAHHNFHQFIDGKASHIRSITVASTEESVEDPPKDRFSWGETSYNFQELQKLDLPVQLAYYRGLQLWKSQETAKKEESPSQIDQRDTDIVAALDLQPTEKLESVESKVEIARPELSGEWTRNKRYICSPCGEIFDDFYALIDHQQASHTGVWFTHIQVGEETGHDLAEELTRQIKRSGNGGPTTLPSSFQCTKCHFVIHSIPELHSHILLCSNHVSTSPCRKRRVKVNPRSRKSHWSNNESSNSTGVNRNVSSQSKTNGSATRSLRSRSPKEDFGEEEASSALRRSARRTLTFSEPPPAKKKRSADVTERVLRKRLESPKTPVPVSSKSVQKEVSKKKATPKHVKENGVDSHECDGCQKKFQSHTSVLKHKYYCPNKTEPAATPNNSSTPLSSVKRATNGQTKIRSKSLPQVNAKQGKTVNAKMPSSSPKVKSKSTELPNGVETPKAKASRKKVPIITPAPKNNPSKSKVAEKTPKTAPKIACEQEELKFDDVTVTPGRPLRSSRKSSTAVVMEDQIEASFLEALSPDQRVRVAEQKCPFCSKHYVYRSNFKKHLIEGCDTADVDEPSDTSVPLKTTKENGKVEKASVSTNNISKEKKRPKEETILKKVKKVPEKKTSVKQKVGKNAKVSSKKGKSTKPVAGKKSLNAEKKVIKKSKSALKTKTTPSGVEEKSATSEEINGEPCETLNNENSDEISKVTEETKSTSLNDENLTDKDTVPEANEVEMEKADEVDSLSKNSEIIPSDEVNISHEKEENRVLEIQNSDVIEPTIIENKKEHVIQEEPFFVEKQLTSEQDKVTCYQKDASSEENLLLATESNSKQSHALDKKELGPLLDRAIKTGLFKPYKNLTKYPKQMRQLKALAQTYCQ